MKNRLWAVTGICLNSRAAKLYLTYLLLPLIPLQINGLRVEGEQPSLRLRIVGPILSSGLYYIGAPYYSKASKLINGRWVGRYNRGGIAYTPRAPGPPRNRVELESASALNSGGRVVLS